MSDQSQHDDVPSLLLKSRDGDTRARDILIEDIYSELKVVANAYMMRERGDHTLSPTALVHEAFLKLDNECAVSSESKTHLKGLYALQMGRILADYGRARQAKKRGGGKRTVTLESGVEVLDKQGFDAVEVADLLDRLSDWNERHADVVRMRVFSRMTTSEIATELGVSESTVKSDWAAARAFMLTELIKDL